mgnify:CR=1 FL=1
MRAWAQAACYIALIVMIGMCSMDINTKKHELKIAQLKCCPCAPEAPEGK